MSLLTIKKGSSNNLSGVSIVDGQLLVTTDTKKIYLDNGSNRLLLNDYPVTGVNGATGNVKLTSQSLYTTNVNDLNAAVTTNNMLHFIRAEIDCANMPSYYSGNSGGVIQYGGGTSWSSQLFFGFTSQAFIRSRTNGDWDDWYQFYTTKYKPTYSDVGAPSTTGVNASGTWGINITGTATLANGLQGDTATTAVPLADIGAGKIKYYYNIISSLEGNMPASNNANGILYLQTHGGEYGYQLGFSSNGNIYYRYKTGSAFTTSTPWYALLSTKNFTTHITPAAIGAATSSHTHSYLPLSGGTMTGTLNFANNIGISGLMAGGSDGWTLCGSGADDAGILKLTISDNLASDFFDIIFDDWDADPVTSFRFGGTNTYCYTPLYIQGNKAWHGGNLKYSLSGTTLTITTS